MIERCLREKTAVSFETTCVRKAGPTFPVQLKAAALNPETDAYHLVCFGFDISGFKSALEEQARLVTAVEHAAESIIVTDPEGIIEYVNPAFEKITGYHRDTIGHTGCINVSLRVRFYLRQVEGVEAKMFVTSSDDSGQ